MSSRCGAHGSRTSSTSYSLPGRNSCHSGSGTAGAVPGASCTTTPRPPRPTRGRDTSGKPRARTALSSARPSALFGTARPHAPKASAVSHLSWQRRVASGDGMNTAVPCARRAGASSATVTSSSETVGNSQATRSRAISPVSAATKPASDAGGTWKKECPSCSTGRMSVAISVKPRARNAVTAARPEGPPTPVTNTRRAYTF